MIEYLRVGKILKAQGIKGEVKVFSTSSDVNRFKSLKKIYLNKNEDIDFKLDDNNSKIFNVENTKMLNDGVILKLDGINTPEDAEKYRGYSIYIDRSDSLKLNQNEYFIPDLIGMEVLDKDGGKLLKGKVKDIQELKTSFNLIIEYNNKDIYIPFAIDYIDKIDMDRKQIFVNLMEGILDL